MEEFFDEFKLNNEVTKYRNNQVANKRECSYICIGGDFGCHQPVAQYLSKIGQTMPVKPRFNKRWQYANKFTTICNMILSKACLEFEDVLVAVTRKINLTSKQNLSYVTMPNVESGIPQNETYSSDSSNNEKDKEEEMNKTPAFTFDEPEFEICQNEFPKLCSFFDSSVSKSKMSVLIEEIVRFHKDKSLSILFNYKNDAVGLLVPIPQTRSHNYKSFCQSCQQSKWMENVMIHIGGANSNKLISPIEEGALFMSRYLAQKFEAPFLLAAK